MWAAWSPDGRLLATSGLVDYKPYLSVYDAGGKRLSRIRALGGWQWSRSGLLAVPEGTATTIRSATGRVRARVPGDAYPVWSLDGGRLALAAPESLRVVTADGKTVRRIGDPRLVAPTASCSPSRRRGEHARRLRQPPDFQSLAIARADGTNRRALTLPGGGSAFGRPAWSPTEQGSSSSATRSKRIAFAAPAGPDAPFELFVVPAAGGRSVQLTHDGAVLRGIAWTR